jgi:hypothetical protein
MLTQYINAALKMPLYRVLEDRSWFAEIPGFEGVWANGATVEECRQELQLRPSNDSWPLGAKRRHEEKIYGASSQK